MKKIFLILLLNLFTHVSIAQWVTIPDTNFVNYLNDHFGVCMNGNQLDTTCNLIVTINGINCSNLIISDLEGIQYFDSLKLLTCNYNLLSSFPPLPQGLTSLSFFSNSFSTLPILPPNLNILNFSSNQISVIPNLPVGLTILYCSSNQLASLPPLPNGLEYVDCSNNLVQALPFLPSTLQTLICGNNSLDSLPQLPGNLKTLHCGNNQLNYLPALPDSLENISCHVNQISQFPTLPSALKYLDCSSNQLTSLPILPATLLWLKCGNNFLTSIQDLPAKVKVLYCYGNQLNFLPELPDTLDELYISNNPGIQCLAPLNKIQIFTFNSTGILCVPNYGDIDSTSPDINTFPICDIFNSNNCDFYWNISGTTFQDLNVNCVLDSLESVFRNIKLNFYSSSVLVGNSYTNFQGKYTYDSGFGAYNYSVDTSGLPFNVVCPPTGEHNSIITPIDSLDLDMDFSLECKAGFDLAAVSILNRSAFFPGTNLVIEMGVGDFSGFYGYHCANSVSGSVVVQITGPVSYVSPVLGALTPQVSGNTLSYLINDFGTVNFNSDFRILLNTDSTAQSGDTVCLEVSVNPVLGDNFPSNNSFQKCFVVVNSFDPNEKEVYPPGNILPDQDWLNYTVRFQNTGTAPAHNIYILDTLDQNVVPSSFTYLSSSHDPFIQVIGNIVKFNFSNIYLPDSTNDEPNSHGYVQYKIRPEAGLALGTTISNKANIYFDFNPPVITNTVINTITNSVGINEVSGITDISIFPNPTNYETKISFYLEHASVVKIDILNLYGTTIRSILDRNINSGKHEINILTGQLLSGIYHLRMVIGDISLTKKIVILNND